ncbi:MAG: glutamate--cysteine ligase [Alphaproteobacteria bacterium]
MSGPSQEDSLPIYDKHRLVSYIAEGEKPKSGWLIGTEHEKFAFDPHTLKRLPYEGAVGIRALLMALMRYGWEPVVENENVIALVKGGASVTLEPGGQFELSGAPLKNLFQTCNEVNEHLRQVKEVGAELGVGFLGLGFDPKWPRADVPWMPKGRYRIMRAYMPKRGSLGLDMMVRTCTVQVNLDFSSEADMVKKFRVSLALQPVATALFANSPFTEGKPNGFQSLRSHIWTDTDPDRCGMLDFVFEPGMGYERYVDYLLDVPMYFVYRNGVYHDASGQSFRDMMVGELPAMPGVLPTTADWVDHMTTAFPEVRLKRFLEMRGADSGPWSRLCALPALWVGLLYDQGALDAAWDLVKGWTREERNALRADVPRFGLKTKFRKGTLLDLARATLAIAHAGLKARDCRNATGEGEGVFLGALDDIAASGRSPSDALLEAYETRWGRSVDPVYREFAY